MNGNSRGNLENSLRAGVDVVFFARQLGFDAEDWQEKILRSSSKRLILNTCRQSGKSTLVAILATHRCVYFAGSLVLIISPSLRQSSELFRKVSEFLDILGIKSSLLEDNRLSCQLSNKSRIVSLPAGENKIRGFSNVDILIEDESARCSDELYFSSRPMIATSGGSIYLLSTPFGKNNHFYREWTEGQHWEKYFLPATECERINSTFLEEEKLSLGSWWYGQEYMCEFKENVDAVFNYDLVQATLDDTLEPLFPEEIIA